MEVKNCAYCGGIFIAQTKRAKYCCERCRKYFHRYKKQGNAKAIHRAKAQAPVAINTITPRVIVTEFDVEATLAEAHTVAAKLDVYSQRAPEKYKDVCRVVGNDISQSLRRVGL